MQRLPPRWEPFVVSADVLHSNSGFPVSYPWLEDAKLPGSAHDTSTAAVSLRLLLTIYARDHARQLRHGEPPGGQPDQQKDQLRRVELILQHAAPLCFSEPRHRALVMRRPSCLIDGGTLSQALPKQKPYQIRMGRMVVENASRVFADVFQTRRVHFQGYGKLPQLFDQDRLEEEPLVSKVVVKPFLVDSCQIRDPLHGRTGRTVCRKLRTCCLLQTPACLSRVPCHVSILMHFQRLSWKAAILQLERWK